MCNFNILWDKVCIRAHEVNYTSQTGVYSVGSQYQLCRANPIVRF